MRILKILGASWKGKEVSVVSDIEMDVTTIISKLRNSSQSSVSQDLGRLRASGLVVSDRRGLHVFYKLSGEFCSIMNNLGNPEIATERHRALSKGKNRQQIVQFLLDNPGSRSKDICPELDRTTVSHELSVLRRANVLDVQMDGKKKIFSIKVSDRA